MFGRRKTMKRKIALVCMAALTGTMLITACGSNETGKNVTASDGKASFIIEDWSEISENLSLSFEQLFNPSAYMDVKEVLKEAAEAQ